jgi:hypothetical protein
LRPAVRRAAQRLIEGSHSQNVALSLDAMLNVPVRPRQQPTSPQFVLGSTATLRAESAEHARFALPPTAVLARVILSRIPAAIVCYVRGCEDNDGLQGDGQIFRGFLRTLDSYRSGIVGEESLVTAVESYFRHVSLAMALGVDGRLAEAAEALRRRLPSPELRILHGGVSIAEVVSPAFAELTPLVRLVLEASGTVRELRAGVASDVTGYWDDVMRGVGLHYKRALLGVVAQS